MVAHEDAASADWNIFKPADLNLDAGGTHASVVTMGQKFTTTEQHIDYMKRVAEAIRSDGM